MGYCRNTGLLDSRLSESACSPCLLLPPLFTPWQHTQHYTFRSRLYGKNMQTFLFFIAKVMCSDRSVCLGMSLSYQVYQSSSQDNPLLQSRPPPAVSIANSLTSIFIKTETPLIFKGNGSLCFIDVYCRHQFNLHSKPQIGPLCHS